MDTGEDRVNFLSNRITGCALTVLHTLGTGFLEKIYENALVHELRKSGLAVPHQDPVVVRYDGIVVGEYAVVELKISKRDRQHSSRAVPELSESHRLASLPATQLRQASP
jgi:GxxExxY protein